MTQVFLCSGDTTRTCDLRVMSPTSYQLLHPAIYLLLPISIHSRTCVRQLTDMSPTSYQLLHPAIYLLLPISIHSRTCVRQLTDMSPTSIRFNCLTQMQCKDTNSLFKKQTYFSNDRNN